MTAHEVKPALSSEEWRLVQMWSRGKMVGGRVPGRVVLDLGDRQKHAAAALALHGQPFGFTREDVTLLHSLGTFAYNLHAEAGEEADGEKFEALARDLADRIAALLPPEAP